MNHQQLLYEISGIGKKYKNLNEKTGGCFNIFEIANIESHETTICRVITELISPVGSHFQGHVYLKLFFEHVLKKNIDFEELKTAQVYREYLIHKQRRVDIVIETAKRTIPIEVKIYAGDQNNQCADYFKIAKASNVYYLTLYGNSPSKESARGLTVNGEEEYLEVTCISFSDDILRWLECCLKHFETIKIASIREIMIQFMSTIRKLTNQMEDNEEMEVKNLIMKSPEHMKSAVTIERSIKEAKRDFLERVLVEVEKNVRSLKLNNEYDYAFSEKKKINDFYKYSTKSSSPGISWFYKSDTDKNVDIWVRFELDWGPFVGYCTTRKNKFIDSVYSDCEVKKMFDVEEATNDGHWLHYEWLPEDNEETYPDFVELDDCYFELYDAENFSLFINKCVNKINEMLIKE